MTDLPGPLPDYIVHAANNLGRNIPRLRSADMVLTDPDLQYLLRGSLPRKGVAAIYGPPGSGKTFLAMDLVFSAASGLPNWFCIPMKAAKVVYVTLEGHGGTKKRIKAWQQHHGIDLDDAVQVWMEPFCLNQPQDIEDLAREAISLLGTGCVIVIDTLAQSMAGFDENSSADMGAAIGGAQRLASLVDGLVILIHHSGKDPTKGMRGHSSLLGAVDASFEVNAKPAGRSWKVRKSKDGEAGLEYDFDLHHIDLGTDSDGEPVGSCVVRQTVRSHVLDLRPVQGIHRVAVMAKLLSIMSNGIGALDFEAAAALVAPDLKAKSHRQLTVAKSTIKSLVESGHLTREGDAICLPA